MEIIRKQEVALSRPRIPIIALSANVMDNEVKACLAAGMDKTPAKPIIIADLTAALAGV